MNTSVPPHAPGEAPGATPPPQPDEFDRFFAKLRGIGWFRSEHERWIGGVCGGIAERLRVDPLIVRAAFVLLGLVFGAGVTIYLIAWILLPDRGGAIVLQRAVRGKDAGAVGLVVVASIIALSGFGLFWGWGGPGPVVPVLLVVGLLIYLLGKQSRPGTDPGSPQPGATPPTTAAPAGSAGGQTRPNTSAYPSPTTPSTSVYAPDTASSASASSAVVPFGTAGSELGAGADPSSAAPQYYSATSTSTTGVAGSGQPGATPPGATPPAPAAWGPVPPPPPRPRRRRLSAAATLILLGIAAIVGSATTLIVGSTDLSDVSARLGIAAATVTVGVGVIAAGFVGRTAGFAAFMGILLALITAASAAVPRDLSFAGPHGQQSWTPVAATSKSYRMGAGEGQLDLRRLSEPTEKATITTRMSLGELRIIVPEDLSVRIRAHVDGGQITSREVGRDATVGTGDLNASRTFTFGPDTPVLTVDADLGYGEITIERTPS